MTYWAVDGCTFEVTGASSTLASGDGATITATYTGPDSVAVDGSTALCGSVTLALTGGTLSAVSGVSGTGTATLQGSAQRVAVDGAAALLLGDSVKVSMAGVHSQTGADVAWTFTVAVTDAGQDSVQAE